MILNIVTPLSRGENISKLYENVRSNYDKGVEIIWWIIVDKNAIVDPDIIFALSLDARVRIIYNYEQDAPAGHAHRNLALNVIQESIEEDQWFMSLDDDNIIHKNLIPTLAKVDTTQYVGILVDQVFKDGSKRLVVEKDNVGLNRTDTAQFILKVEEIGDLRFEIDRYDADGLFIYEFYEDNKEKFLIINEDLSYYNYLR